MPTTLCLILFATAVAADSDDELKKEKKALAGGWTAVSAERDGEKILPEEEVRKIRLYFADERLTLKQGEKGKELLYVVSPSSHPSAIDLKAMDGPYRRKSLEGIYELDGDNLKICFPFEPQTMRPTEFATSAGSKLLLLVLKREK